MNNTKFDDIAPLAEEDVKQAIQDLLADPGFEHAVKYIMPKTDWDEFSKQMRSFNTRQEFQHIMVYQTMWALAANVTTGLTGEGWENIEEGKNYTFLSNHRDIVLDASFLNILCVKQGLPTTEIAIGDNLLIHPWIDTLVRLNKSFIVRRGISVRQMLLASKHMSEYIHYAINEKKESVWIAQREGRAKDSNDKTQESVLKMLSLAPEGGHFIDNLKDINILPLSISYEYDPCDYLKAREFQLKRDNPDYKKSQRDDLLNMEIGMLGNKGKVVFRFGKCINSKLDKIKEIESDKRIQAELVGKAIDNQIYKNYEIYPCNYIAHDLLNNEKRFHDKYTSNEVKEFREYLNSQLAKIEDLPHKDIPFLYSKMLEMYSNTLKNHLIATGKLG